VIAAVREGAVDDDKAHRLIGRLWTLERMFYYIYGGWGQGLEMNDFQPSVKSLFSKQIADESTHEMLYLDAQLKKGIAGTQGGALSKSSSLSPSMPSCAAGRAPSPSGITADFWAS